MSFRLPLFFAALRMSILCVSIFPAHSLHMQPVPLFALLLTLMLFALILTLFALILTPLRSLLSY